MRPVQISFVAVDDQTYLNFFTKGLFEAPADSSIRRGFFAFCGKMTELYFMKLEKSIQIVTSSFS
jgi:hypothetical protein